AQLCSPQVAIPEQLSQFVLEGEPFTLNLLFGAGVSRESIVNGQILIGGAPGSFNWVTGQALAPVHTGSGVADGTSEIIQLAGTYQGQPLRLANRRTLRILQSNGDFDGDGLLNTLEFVLGLNPAAADSDDDGIADGFEDNDNDGLNNLEEIALGTLPDNADSDNDGLSDGLEVNLYNTNPLHADTDGDGISDHIEVDTGSSPTDPQDYDIAPFVTALSVTPQTIMREYAAISPPVQLTVQAQILANGHSYALNVTAERFGTQYASDNIGVATPLTNGAYSIVGVGTAELSVSLGSVVATVDLSVNPPPAIGQGLRLLPMNPPQALYAGSNHGELWLELNTEIPVEEITEVRLDGVPVEFNGGGLVLGKTVSAVAEYAGSTSVLPEYRILYYQLTLEEGTEIEFEINLDNADSAYAFFLIDRNGDGIANIDSDEYYDDICEGCDRHIEAGSYIVAIVLDTYFIDLERYGCGAEVCTEFDGQDIEFEFVLRDINAESGNDGNGDGDAEASTGTIQVLFPDGVPLDTVGQLEVDFRSWRADEITTAALQVPVIADPAPQISFDLSLGDTINAVVGEALDIPFMLDDPGRNNLIVEYLLDGEVLQANNYRPLALNVPAQGLLKLETVISSGGYGDDTLFNAAYYSLHLPQAQEFVFDLSYDSNNGDIAGSIYIYRDDGELTLDDAITHLNGVTERNEYLTLPAGDYVIVVVPNDDDSLDETIIAREALSCNWDCPQADIPFELILRIPNAQGYKWMPFNRRNDNVSRSVVDMADFLRINSTADDSQVFALGLY
ncbi:MAG TPA: hypothetical protein VGL10_07465, partial [Gammaproteobacteria bacterium]